MKDEGGEKLPLIRSLLCHSQVDMALRCFASLRRFHRPDFRLRIHDDGTLTPADRERLLAALPGVNIVSRAEADAAVDPLLERLPACRAYRREQAVSAKLLDVPLMGEGPSVCIDPDVLYLRPFAGFHRLRESCPQPIFMQDLWDTYAMRYWELLNPFRMRIVQRLNAGVIVIDPGQIDLELLEWFLRRPRSWHFSHIEQSYWAALSHRDGGRLLSPEQFNYPPAGAEGLPPLARRPVAWHFIGPLRGGFDAAERAVMEDEESDAMPPAELTTFQPKTLNFLRYCRTRWHKQRFVWQNQPA
jgi:hypothetical protein